jgi:hypothetical protein
MAIRDPHSLRAIADDMVRKRRDALRDGFATAAATGAFRGGDTDIDDAIFARRCYQLADALLKAREAE